METRMTVPPKRDHKAGDQGDADAAKKSKMEPDAEETEYRLDWDDSWWPCVEPDHKDRELLMDCNAFQARMFCESWNGFYSVSYGPFEAETTIPSKRFTDSEDGEGESTLQIFSVKVTGIRGGLQWPIDVYGRVADSSLILTGPIRAVMVSDHLIFEADLKVKGNIESEDKMLSFLAARFTSHDAETYLIKEDYISKLSKLEFTLGYILHSVEATIDMRVTDGTWLDGFHGEFVARIDSIKEESLFSMLQKVPGELIVSVETWQGVTGKVNLRKDEKSFASLEMSRSRGKIDVGFSREARVALRLFRRMLASGVVPEEVSVALALTAVARLGVAEFGSGSTHT
ncbi:hypothetical protein PR202_gb15410 [Eleusine coracana subsp. coracana]|uniref:DUF6598 domain-containing protein n=1 Tax=Eleusine coracana subsp. coracana TaxID=191504 RepID=A0AAV5EZ19_ELECO|nr:hypothetical protein PR202_gb15410 [Eleusine coracana subsp. coracana]